MGNHVDSKLFSDEKLQTAVVSAHFKVALEGSFVRVLGDLLLLLEQLDEGRLLHVEFKGCEQARKLLVGLAVKATVRSLLHGRLGNGMVLGLGCQFILNHRHAMRPVAESELDFGRDLLLADSHKVLLH